MDMEALLALLREERYVSGAELHNEIRQVRIESVFADGVLGRLEN